MTVGCLCPIGACGCPIGACGAAAPIGFPCDQAELAARVTIAMQTPAERMTLSHRFPLHPKIVPVVVTVETCGACPTALAVGSSIRENARQAKVLTKDEARRIAANVTPELLGKGERAD